MGESAERSAAGPIPPGPSALKVSSMGRHGLSPRRNIDPIPVDLDRPPVTRARLLIDANLIREIGTALRSRPYEVYPTGVRIKLAGSSHVLEPDVAVARCPIQFESNGEDALLNPALVFEVLSEAREGRYRGEMFRRYATIPSLGAIVLIAPGEAFIERFERLREGSWAVATFGPGESLALPKIDLALRVDEVYRGLSFGAGASSPPARREPG